MSGVQCGCTSESRMKSKPTNDARVKAVNAAFIKMSAELKRFRAVCDKNEFPIRVVTYRVGDDNEARCHVMYRQNPTARLKGL